MERERRKYEGARTATSRSFSIRNAVNVTATALATSADLIPNVKSSSSGAAV
jgi:hypothetical protein